MFRLVLTLLTHRTTWRFLLVLSAALGYTLLADQLSGLEAAVCSVLTCVD